MATEEEASAATPAPDPPPETRDHRSHACPQGRSTDLADAAKGKISNESPVGASLLGKAVGDSIDVNVPKGLIKVKVLKID